MSDPLTAVSIATLIFTTAVGTLTESLTEDARQQLGQKLQALKQLIANVIHQWLPQVDDDDLMWPYVGLGRFYEGQGLYAQAESWSDQCLVMARERLGDEHPDVASSLNNLALLYNH